MAAVDDVPRVLARNNACHQCRKRKLKCDAVRPTCSHCAKPRVRGAAAQQPHEPCSWNTVRPETSGMTRPRSASGEREAEPTGRGKKSRIAELEARLAAFEGMIPPEQRQGHQKTNPAVEIVNPDRWTRLTQRPLKLARPSAPSASTSPADQPLFTDPTWGLNDNDFASGSTFGSSSALVWPDWPRDLPSFQVVQHAVGIFFDKVPSLPKMLHRSSFMAQLQLPPSHYAFPCPSLLHAILAITANHMPEAALATMAYFPVGTPHDAYEHPVRDFDPEHEPARILGFAAGWRSYASESAVAKFQLWHRRKAYESAPTYFDKGEKLLQCLQAHVIATTVDQYNAWWVDVWMEAGACLRMSVPLGLNESKNVHPDALAVNNVKHLLMPASNAREHDERVRTWWMAYMLERSVGMSCLWPPALADEEISIELPITQSAFDLGLNEGIAIQNLHSPDFYSAFPPVHGDSLNFLIKAHKLQGEVNAFFRRYSKGPFRTQLYAADPNLRALLSKLSTLRLSCPAHLRRPAHPLNGSLDVDLIGATMLTHSGCAVLAEPLITTETWTHDVCRMCLSSIRSVLSILYDITATSFDLTLLPPAVAWAWTVAARCLLRFIGAAGEAGDLVSVHVFTSEVAVFRLALQRFGERFPIGKKHLDMLDLIAERNEPISSALCPVDEIFKGVTVSAIGEGSTRTTPSFASLSTPPNVAPASSGHASAEKVEGQSANMANLEQMFGHDTSAFDISSFSFDYQAISELFANSEAVFNG